MRGRGRGQRRRVVQTRAIEPRPGFLAWPDNPAGQLHDVTEVVFEQPRRRFGHPSAPGIADIFRHARRENLSLIHI